MQCANCRAEVQPGDRFCAQCGNAQPARCIECGGAMPASARFCPHCGARQAVGMRVPPAEAPPPPSGPERRHLTVMFCDLAGSSALANRLDPEDYHQVVNAYYAIVAAEVGRFDGFVARHVGDGVLVYFGHPQAHEDDSERAIRAGLAITTRVAALDLHGVDDLRVRIGIATGLVVADTIGHGSGTERTISGHTPNLAARLQAMARPGGVVVAADTYDIVSGAFEFADLGDHHFKGMEPVRVYEVVRPRSRDDRRLAMFARSVPLIGRSEELGLLMRRWTAALGGEGSAVLVSGDPGIGKSRILQAFIDRVAAARPHTLYLHGSPHHEDSALFPLVGALGQAAGLFPEDSHEIRACKALRWSESIEHVDVADRVVLADLAAGDTGAACCDDALTPRHRMERTLRVLSEYVASVARSQPTLIVFEDAHWSDPSSLEFVRQLVEALAPMRVLLVVTARPAYQPDWLGLAHVSLLHVNRLSRREGADLIRKVTGSDALPDDVIAAMVDRADGVPLFLEELTKTVIEEAVAVASGRARPSSPRHGRPAIPPTLQASLLARLDRLTVARELAQEAASIGREFALEVIAAVTDRAEEELIGALHQLELAGLLLRRGLPPRTSYYFKHALMQDAAYETLTRPKRERLHRRIAEIYEERFREVVDSRPEILAHHLQQANLEERAIEAWLRAAAIAMQRGAIAEAVAQIERGLSLVDRLLADEERKADLELQLQLQLANALMAARGYADAATGAAFRRARALCEALGDQEQSMRIAWGQFSGCFAGGQLRPALAEAEELLVLARRFQDVAGLQMGHASAGTALLHLGRLSEAETELRCALDFDVPDQRAAAFLYGQSARITALAYLSLAVLLRGDGLAGRDLSRQSIAEAQGLGHAPSLCFARSVACRVAFLRGEQGELAILSEQVERDAEDQGMALWRALGSIYRGWNQSLKGDIRAAIVSIRAGLAAYRSIGGGLSVGLYLATLGTLVARAEAQQAATELFEEALVVTEQSGETWVRPEIQRRHAEVLVAAGRPLQGCEAAEDARRLAQQTGAVLWERMLSALPIT